jgi:hypothetical protein
MLVIEWASQPRRPVKIELRSGPSSNQEPGFSELKQKFPRSACCCDIVMRNGRTDCLVKTS